MMQVLSSVIKAEKQRKTIEWETLDSLQENQKYQVNISCKDENNNDRNGMDVTAAEYI